MNARERIMQRLQTRSSSPPALSPQKTAAPPGEDWPDKLATRLTTRGISVYRARTLAAARLHVAAWLQEHHATAAIGWSEAAVGVPGLPEMLHSLGITWHYPPYTEVHDALVRRKEGLIGITGVHGVVVNVPALVLVDTEDTPLLPALLPPIHVAVVLPDRAFSSLAAWWRHHTPRGPVITLHHVPRVWALGVPSTTSGLGPRLRHVVIVERIETTEAEG